MTFLQKNAHSFYPFPSNSTTTRDTMNVKTVDQVSTIKSLLFPPLPPPLNFSDMKRDPGGIGFIDDVGGSVDGLMSCTESLGFESSDERRVDDEIEIDLSSEKGFSSLSGCGNLRLKREHVRREVKDFPPPLSSLDQNGKPTFFLRPVRRDGKLELQEVKINRPEVLCASRGDGRLRLHFVSNEDDEIDEEGEGLFEEEEEEEISDEEEVIQEEENYIEYAEAGSVEEREEEWRIPVNQQGGCGGGDGGFRRCYEQVSHHQNHHHHGGHHHHGLHVWSRHCVTIR